MRARLRRGGRIYVAGAALVAVAFGAAVIVGLGILSDGNSPSAHFAPIAQAAEQTARVPGARMAITMELDVPARGETGRMEGSGVYDGRTQRFRMTLQVVDGLGEGASQTAVSEGATLYMRSPLYSAEAPPGKRWMRLDVSDQAPGGNTQLGAGVDPNELLRWLKSVAPDAERLGEERIRGVDTAHYSATVDLRREVERLRSEGADEAAEELEGSIEGGDDALPTEVWIDDDGLLRRMDLTISFDPLAEEEFQGAEMFEGAEMTMRMELYDFGITPRIELPPEERVFDAPEPG